MAIIPALVAVGEAVKASWANSVRDAIESILGTLSGIEIGIPNKSFEQEGDSGATSAAGWVYALGTGGSIERSDSDSISGAWALKVTRTGVAGSNGGSVTSDFFEISPTLFPFNYGYQVNVDVDSTIYLEMYDADQAFLDEVILSTLSGIFTYWTGILVDVPLDDGDARFGKIRIEGGQATSPDGGMAYIYFDGLQGNILQSWFYLVTDTKQDDFTEFSTPNAIEGQTYATYAKALVLVPDGATTISVTIEGKCPSSTMFYRANQGASAGSEVSATGQASFVSLTSTVVVPVGASGALEVEIQLRSSTNAVVTGRTNGLQDNFPDGYNTDIVVS